MANRSKAKGTKKESEVLAFLQHHGHPNAYRMALQGALDKGDIGGLPVTIEVKNHAAMDLSTWCDEAHKEAINAGTYRWAVVHHRRSKNVRDSYVTLPLWFAAELFALLAASPQEDVA